MRQPLAETTDGSYPEKQAQTSFLFITRYYSFTVEVIRDSLLDTY